MMVHAVGCALGAPHLSLRSATKLRSATATAVARPVSSRSRQTIPQASSGAAEHPNGPQTAGSQLGVPLPPVVNWHLEARCNYGCKFCFATFEDVKEVMKGSQLPTVLQEGAGAHNCTSSASSLDSIPTGGAPTREQLLAVPHLLAAQGISRLSFVGGEPLLHPLIFELISAAKAAGLATSMVTNGSLLDAAGLLRLSGSLDWLAFSVDASNDELHAAIGRGVRGDISRGHSSHLAHVREVWRLAQELGFKLKLNTVVTRATLQDDMAPLVAELQPARWKVFQVLPIEGQNDGSVDDLLVGSAQFQEWVDRHRAALARAAASSGAPCVPLVAESNEAMQGSYAMLDATCRFFSNATGKHEYSPPIFPSDQAEGHVAGAWAGVSGAGGFSGDKFGARGGVYDWGQGGASLAAQLEHWGGAK